MRGVAVISGGVAAKAKQQQLVALKQHQQRKAHQIKQRSSIMAACGAARQLARI